MPLEPKTARERPDRLRAALERGQRTQHARVGRAYDDIRESYQWYRRQVASRLDAQRYQDDHRRHVRRLKGGLYWLGELRRYLRETVSGDVGLAWRAECLDVQLQETEELIRRRTSKRHRTKTADVAKWQLVWDLAVSLDSAGFAVNGSDRGVLHLVLAALENDPADPEFTWRTKPIVKLLHGLKDRLADEEVLVPSCWGSQHEEQLRCWSVWPTRVPGQAQVDIQYAVLLRCPGR